MSKERAFCTGITGQDGSYLAEFLLKKGYEVYGLKRRTSEDGYNNVKHIINSIKIIEGDLSDQISLNQIIKEIRPSEVYHLAAQSHVATSFKQPLYTSDVTGLGTLRLLEAIKEFSPTTKFYNAATSELFGGVSDGYLNEESLFYPRSPYAISKLFGFWTTINYREAYNIFACNGILFNHESERRGINFVTRKITKAAARIKLGFQNKLILGNIDSKRDIGHAKDYVEGMWLMLQADKPANYVLATGEMHSIKEMLDVVFEYLKLDWYKFVEISQDLYRPTEVNTLCGDYSKAKNELGWSPKVSWKQLLIDMVDHDLNLEGA